MNPKPARGASRIVRRGLLVAGLLLGLLLVLAFVFRARLLTGVADYLIVDDPLQPADVIFVLNGDFNTRPFRAAELYQQGLAPLIVMARAESQPAEKLGLVQNDTDISVGVMEKLGVPPDRILVLPVQSGVTSTFDEAYRLRQYIADNGIRRVLVVTSAFHTRRARWVMKKELAGLPVALEISAVPYPGFDATNWWKNEGGLIALNNEYIKLFYYYWKYR